MAHHLLRDRAVHFLVFFAGRNHRQVGPANHDADRMKAKPFGMPREALKGSEHPHGQDGNARLQRDHPRARLCVLDRAVIRSGTFRKKQDCAALFQHLDDAAKPGDIVAIAVDWQHVANGQKPAPERRFEETLATQVKDFACDRPTNRGRVHVADVIGDDQAAAIRDVFASFDSRPMESQLKTDDVIRKPVIGAHRRVAGHNLDAVRKFLPALEHLEGVARVERLFAPADPLLQRGDGAMGPTCNGRVEDQRFAVKPLVLTR